MWKCHKCGKPVYFAERKQSLGYDWHPECLRCEECGKRLNPGQHAEHKGVPYCHVPCYGALFGPQLFGHGTRVESHTSFGKVENRSGGPNMPRSHLESKLKLFNQFYDGNSGEIRSREVNGRLVLEGALRIHWGVLGMIHLKEDDDQRTVITIRKRNSCRSGIFNGVDFEVDSPNANDDEVSDTTGSAQDSGLSDITGSVLDSRLSDLTGSAPDSGLSDVTDASLETVSVTSEEAPRSVGARTLPLKLDNMREEWDELDELLQVERRIDNSDKLYQTMPTGLPSTFSTSSSERSNSLSTQSSVETPEAEELDKNDTSHDIYEETLEKNLNRSLSGPDCFQRSRNGNLNEAGVQRSKEVWSRNQKVDPGVVIAADLEAKRLQQLTLTDEIPTKMTHDLDSDDSTIEYDDNSDHCEVVVTRRAVKTGSTAIRRRPGKRRSRTALKRRCSINGHFYDRETSFFTPPRGSNMSVWVTSLVNTQEVVNLLLDKYKVDSRPTNFALFVVRDNGEQRRLRDDEYPLLVRVMLGPHEDVAKLFIMDRQNTEEISADVAQFLNLSSTECKAILERYRMEEEREAKRVRAKFREMRKRIKQRMEDLKVRL